MKDKRRDIIMKKNARKAMRMKTPGSKSRYQQKQARKYGKGSVRPNWMWWMERTTAAAVKAAA